MGYWCEFLGLPAHSCPGLKGIVWIHTTAHRTNVPCVKSIIVPHDMLNRLKLASMRIMAAMARMSPEICGKVYRPKYLLSTTPYKVQACSISRYSSMETPKMAMTS